MVHLSYLHEVRAQNVAFITSIHPEPTLMPWNTASVQYKVVGKIFCLLLFTLLKDEDDTLMQ